MFVAVSVRVLITTYAVRLKFEIVSVYSTMHTCCFESFFINYFSKLYINENVRKHFTWN